MFNSRLFVHMENDIYNNWRFASEYDIVLRQESPDFEWPTVSVSLLSSAPDVKCVHDT